MCDFGRRASPDSFGKTADVSVDVRARVPGFDPAEFWQESPGGEQWGAMVDKYDALARAAELAGGPRDDAYRLALTELSSRWPGALREGELIGPAGVRARAAAAARGRDEPARPRAAWTDEDAQAVVCWAVLHLLLADQLAFRRAVGSGPRSTEAFARWVATTERVPRWPEPARIPAVVGPKLRVRGAYLWLCARAGLSLPRLNALLLARAGHWDRRPEDPAWAHD
jgi:hypothetical protein